jgi:NADH-quinone oxidoreductase subunit N
MTFATIDLITLLPEIFMITMACLILATDAYLSDQMRNLTYQLSQGTLIGTALMVLLTYPDQRTLAMSEMFVIDQMGAILKFVALLMVFLAFLYSRDYLKDRQMFKGEYFVLGLFATLGMMIMISAHTLLTIYLGLELLSLSLYTMVAMHRDSPKATEAAMKYFVLGAIASGMLLYGISILYGVTGTIDLAKLAQVIEQSSANNHTLLVFGLVFVVIGIAFKLGAVPFHMWIPDVYQGAPTAVTLFISSAPKLAAFALLMRLLVDGMPQLHVDWQQMLILLSILSMATGNLIAIAQTNLKRMLAYSTIAHVDI